VTRRTIRAVVTADNHLNRYYDRMVPQRLRTRRQHLRRGFHEAVEYAIQHHVDFFLQAGDLFDTPDPRNLDRGFVASELERLRDARIPVYGIGGNHDTPKQVTDQGGALPQRVYSELGALHLFDSDGVPSVTVVVDGVRVAIGALPWSPLVGLGRDPLADIEWNPEAEINIFLFHHSVEGHIFPGANEAIVTRASLDRLHNTDLVVAGHVHHGADWRTGRLHVLIPGATERMTFGETGDPSFSVVEITPGAGVVGLERIKVPFQPRRTLTVLTTDLATADGELCGAIMRRIESSFTADAMVRLFLQGPVTRESYRELDLARLYEFGLSHAFHFELDVSQLVVQDEFGSHAAGGIRISQRDELAACADECLAAAADPAERDLLAETKQAIMAYYELSGVAA
jgi:DNA repair protein SbcD/Mre11